MGLITIWLRKNIGIIVSTIGFILLVILTFGDIGELFTDKYWQNVGGNITSISALSIGLVLIQISIKQGVSEQALSVGLNTKNTKEMYDEQQEKFNSYDESKPFEFEVAIRLKLCEEGLLVNVIQDSIIEGVGNNYGNSEIKDSFKHNLGISQFILFPEAPKLMSTISPFETILTENGILIKFTD